MSSEMFGSRYLILSWSRLPSRSFWPLWPEFKARRIIRMCLKTWRSRKGEIKVDLTINTQKEGKMSLQVSLFQKNLFLPQLTQNMTRDCSLNYKFSTWKLSTSSEHVVYLHILVFVFVLTIQNNLCTQHVLSMFWGCLSLQFSFTELVIQWTIFCHIVG